MRDLGDDRLADIYSTTASSYGNVSEEDLLQLGIRASIQAHVDFYLCPLSAL